MSKTYVGQTDYSKETNPIATIEMENGSIMKIELYPEVAPQSVYNFISLANSGFYNGVIFHRVIRSFMIQGETLKVLELVDLDIASKVNSNLMDLIIR